MVYVFFVQPGDMMTFDHEISIMQSVKDLKEKILQKCGIPLDNQVLLINGGEPLDPEKNLCSYMAGTDTNPIYLFSTNFDVTRIEQLPSSTFDDSDLRKRLKECFDLPATLTTVTRRAQLAQNFHEAARRQLAFCEGLVHDQHMQQQGWAAVIANLEDIMSEFKKRWEIFSNNYRDFVGKKDLYLQYLQSFLEDKIKLQNIPVLDSLIELESEIEDTSQDDKRRSVSEEAPSTENSQSEKDTVQDEKKAAPKNINLFEWIAASDATINSLDDIHQTCQEFLEKVEANIMPTLQRRVSEVIVNSERPDIREIEGLGTRLFHLEETLAKLRKYVQHQSDMAQSFQQNQQRASNLRDLSILEDLCATHKQQLEYIREHHYRLMEDRQKILKAKYELCKSLAVRLRWVEITEDKIYGLDSTLVYINEVISRTKKHVKIFQQIHQAPQIYTSAVAEVVRRRKFSQTFLLWSSEVACHQLAIHNDEVARRKDFGAQFDDHFLSTLFPGMDDLPPAFATDAPPVFDARLPRITEADVEGLRARLPEYADNLTPLELSSYAIFFAARPAKVADRGEEAKAVEERLMQAVSDVGLASNLDGNLLRGAGSELSLAAAHVAAHAKDADKGCESETDTEEFEKVGQSPLELNFARDPAAAATPPPAQRPVTRDASTLTEDNLEITKSEHEKLKSHLVSMGYLAKQVAAELKEELSSLSAQVKKDENTIFQYYESLSTSWDTLLMEKDNQEKQILEDIQKNHNEQVTILKKIEEEKAFRMEELETDKRLLESDIIKTYSEINELQERIIDMDEQSKLKLAEMENRLKEKDLEREKVVKEITERLRMDHRAEIDNIKSRFKIMTMDRSPSNTSLEKSGDFTSLPSHTTLFMQMTENFEMDKQSAIENVREGERIKYEKILEEKIKEIENRVKEEKEMLTQDIARRVSEDKDKQIDLLREREKNLNLECIKYKTTIQQLTESEMEDSREDLEKKCNSLITENQLLKEELEKLKKERAESAVDLITSVAVEGRMDAATSPLRQKADLSASEITTVRPSKISIDSCAPGDLVLVLWDANHESFKIVQESKNPRQHLYFLHTDSLDSLGLSVIHGKPNKMYCSGEVVEKEYCHARKSGNRYKVARGTKFFRVKVSPYAAAAPPATVSLYHARPSTSSAQMSQSHVAEAAPLAEEAAAPSSPPATGESTAPPDGKEKDFAVDSGIVDSVEQAAEVGDSCDTDRCTEDLPKIQQHYISTNWLESMFRSMFRNKGIDN